MLEGITAPTPTTKGTTAARKGLEYIFKVEVPGLAASAAESSTKWTAAGERVATAGEGVAAHATAAGVEAGRAELVKLFSFLGIG